MKRLDRVFICLFFLILCGFLVLYFTAPESTTAEKRDLASLPVFRWDAAEDYPGALEAWMADRFPYRNLWIRLHSVLEHDVFGQFSDADVIVGKEDWFFYAPRVQNLSVSQQVSAVLDHKGLLLPSEEELAETLRVLTAFRDRLAAMGMDFILILSPNKANLYADHLPDYVKITDSAERGDLTVAYLRAHGDLKLFYAKPALLEAKGEAPLYFVYDDHWNRYGAWVAADAFARAFLGTELPRPRFDFQESDFGELADQVGLGGYVREPNDVTVPDEDMPAFHVELNWGRWTNREYIPDPPNPDGERVLVIGDSFGGDFFPYLVPYYEQVSFRRFDMDYGFYDIEEMAPDTVILELTERMVTLPILSELLQE